MDGIHRRAPKKTSEHQTNKRKQYACTPEHKPNKRSSSSSSSTAYGMENGYTPFLLLLLILLFKMSNIDNKTRASEKKNCRVYAIRTQTSMFLPSLWWQCWRATMQICIEKLLSKEWISACFCVSCLCFFWLLMQRVVCAMWILDMMKQLQ